MERGVMEGEENGFPSYDRKTVGPYEGMVLGSTIPGVCLAALKLAINDAGHGKREGGVLFTARPGRASHTGRPFQNAKKQ